MSFPSNRSTRAPGVLAASGAFVALAAAALGGDGGSIRVSTSEQLRRVLAGPTPGTTILIEPGEYEGFQSAGLCGTDSRPIVIAAAERDRAPVFRGGVHFSDIAWLELVGITIEGAPANGLNIDDGGSFESPSRHVVLRDIRVLGCGGRGNEDGIKLSGVDDFRIERCTVERWGRGGSAVDMVGCHRGVIEACAFRDRAEDSASSGVQAKGGSCDVTIRLCRFEHAGDRAVNLGGSTGLQYFRPKPDGFEARDVAVEGCTFIGSEAPIAFVGVDGATVRFNTFVRPGKWILRILQETREPGFAPCRAGTFADNLVVYERAAVEVAVNVGLGTEPESFAFARNYWFCVDDPERSIPALPLSEVDSAGGVDPGFRDAASGDFRAAETSPARKHGVDAFVAPAEQRVR